MLQIWHIFSHPKLPLNCQAKHMFENIILHDLKYETNPVMIGKYLR